MNTSIIKAITQYWMQVKSILGLYKVGIYITEEALYFIEIERDVLHYRVKNIDVEWFFPDEKLSEPISRLVSRYPHIKNHLIYSNVSEKSTISEFISLPKMTQEELKKGLHLEVTRHLPYNPNTMSLSYQFLGEMHGHNWVLAVIAKHNQIEEIWHNFQAAGLMVVRLSISNYSFINSLRASRNATIAYLYPEPQSCTINIFDEGLLIFSYTSYAKNLISQLKDMDQSLSQFTKSKDLSKKFSLLRFIGDLSSFPETEKGRFLKYFLSIEQERNYIFPAKSVEKFFVELPAMVGLVLNRKIKINLLPADLVEKTKIFLRRKQIWFGVFIFHVALAMFAVKSYTNYRILNIEEDILFSSSFEKNSSKKFALKPGSLADLANKDFRIKEPEKTEDKKTIYKNQIEYVDNLIKKIQLTKKELAIYQQADRERSFVSFFLYNLAMNIPAEVKIESFFFSEPDTIFLTGYAKDHQVFTKLLVWLKGKKGQNHIHVNSLQEKKAMLFFELKGKWSGQ